MALSVRRRRRVLIALTVVGAGALATTVSLLGHTSDPGPPLSNEPAIREKVRDTVQLEQLDRQAIVRTSRLFVRTAVARRSPGRSWDIVTPALRAGTSKSDWAAGLMPVTPFPVLGARWRYAYVYENEVGLDVLVTPEGKSLRPTLFRLTLVPAAAAPPRDWLVATWTPLQTGDSLISTATSAQSDILVGDPGDESAVRASAYWVLLPFAILGAGLLVPLLVALVRRLERRRSL